MLESSKSEKEDSYEGQAFPELEIWLVNCEEPLSYKRSKWNDLLS